MSGLWLDVCPISMQSTSNNRALFFDNVDIFALLWRQRSCFESRSLLLFHASQSLGDPCTVCAKSTSPIFVFDLSNFDGSSYHYEPNIVVELLPHLPPVREGLGSNLGPGSGYPDRGFSWGFSLPPVEVWDSTSSQATSPFFPTLFLIHYSRGVLSFDAL
jgi:hypothetical protein